MHAHTTKKRSKDLAILSLFHPGLFSIAYHSLVKSSTQTPKRHPSPAICVQAACAPGDSPRPSCLGVPLGRILFCFQDVFEFAESVVPQDIVRERGKDESPYPPEERARKIKSDIQLQQVVVVR